MPLESATYISGLVGTNPAGGDLVSAGDDHLRLIKNVLKNTFPNLSAAVTVTPAELNMLAGVSSNVQTQLAAKAAAVHVHAETDIQDGAVFARLSANETIAGVWTFASRPVIGANPILDAGSAVAEGNITDGALLARVGSNETITGSWNFTTAPLIGGRGAWRWGTTGLSDGGVFLVTSMPADTGTPGSVYLVHE